MKLAIARNATVAHRKPGLRFQITSSAQRARHNYSNLKYMLCPVCNRMQKNNMAVWKCLRAHGVELPKGRIQ